jgi:hypothetical protein
MQVLDKGVILTRKHCQFRGAQCLQGRHALDVCVCALVMMLRVLDKGGTLTRQYRQCHGAQCIQRPACQFSACSMPVLQAALEQ